MAHRPASWLAGWPVCPSLGTGFPPGLAPTLADDDLGFQLPGSLGPGAKVHALELGSLGGGLRQKFPWVPPSHGKTNRRRPGDLVSCA